VLHNFKRFYIQNLFPFLLSDKQQELDIPSFKIEENEGNHKEKENQKETGKRRPMTQITGVRKLKHTNSFTGQVPKYGVETPHKEELGKVLIEMIY
jgi:cAMP-specific phosphodiesterase 4